MRWSSADPPSAHVPHHAVETERGGGAGGVRGRRRVLRRAGGPDEPAAHSQGLRGQAVREGVHQSRHLHLRRLPLETRRRGGRPR